MEGQNGVGGWMGVGVGGRAQDTLKYLDQFLMVFACKFHNRAHFCETIETRVSNPMFQLKLHIALNIKIK